MSDLVCSTFATEMTEQLRCLLDQLADDVQRRIAAGMATAGCSFLAATPRSDLYAGPVEVVRRLNSPPTFSTLWQPTTSVPAELKG